MIDSFRGKYSFLSNMYPCTVAYHDLAYPSAENAYVAAKCRLRDDRINVQTMRPSEAKQFGKTVLRSQGFSRILAMEEVLHNKFGVGLSLAEMSMAHANLQVKLLETGREILIEGNTWHDNFWGNCKCSRCVCTPGANVLGSLLMMVREKVS